MREIYRDRWEFLRSEAPVQPKGTEAKVTPREIALYLDDISDELPVERFERYFEEVRSTMSPRVAGKVELAMKCLREAREALHSR